MDISDIQLVDSTGKIHITFSDEYTNDDVLTVIASKEVIWQIHDYCQSVLSYGAQLKRERR